MPLLEQVVKKARDDPKGFESEIKEVEEYFDELVALCDVSDAEYPRKAAALSEKASRGGIAVRQMTASQHLEKIGSRQGVTATAQCVRLELDAAITYLLDGEKAFQQIKDPYGDGPFEMVQLGGKDFELRSKLKRSDGNPVTLTVGRLPAPAATQPATQPAGR
jgi:hypothetical protein